MRKRLVLATVLATCLAATIGVAIFAQAQPTTPTAPDSSSNVVDFSDGGHVILQLPPGNLTGNLTHPTNLLIEVLHISNESDFGGPDVMEIAIWSPNMNTYVPVAILSTNTNQSAIAWIKSVVNGTPIWNPPMTQNYFVPTNSQLQVMLGDSGVLMANLTSPFNVTLPAALGGNFTIPPMTLMFVPIAAGFAHNESTLIPTSHWMINSSHTDVPCWARVNIPTWLGGYAAETVGTLTLNATSTYIPPAP